MAIPPELEAHLAEIRVKLKQADGGGGGDGGDGGGGGDGSGGGSSGGGIDPQLLDLLKPRMQVPANDFHFVFEGGGGIPVPIEVASLEEVLGAPGIAEDTELNLEGTGRFPDVTIKLGELRSVIEGLGDFTGKEFLTEKAILNAVLQTIVSLSDESRQFATSSIEDGLSELVEDGRSVIFNFVSDPNLSYVGRATTSGGDVTVTLNLVPELLARNDKLGSFSETQPGRATIMGFAITLAHELIHVGQFGKHPDLKSSDEAEGINNGEAEAREKLLAEQIFGEIPVDINGNETSDPSKVIRELPDIKTQEGTFEFLNDLNIEGHTTDNDLIHGTIGSNVIDGKGGDDTAFGHEGTDILLGGDGNDSLDGGIGDDGLDGGSGADTLFGGLGNDVLLGGTGADRLFGGDGNDILNSGSSGSVIEVDTLEGGLGNDRIEITGLLDDRVFDEGGNDRLVLPTLQALTTFVREGNHMAIQNGTTQIVIFDWYLSPDHKIETIEFAGGSTITAAQAEGLASQPPPDCGDPFCGFGFPIVLDLDGDGLELSSAAGSRVRFDMDGDGVRDRTGWIGRDDGFLVFDENGNGRVDGIDEISFTRFAEGARTDLEGLRAFDTDGDGLFSAGDEAYGAFRIWRDANGNGRSERHELLTLEEMGIESLDLAGHLDATVMNGNAVLGRTSFTRTDGTTGEAGDVALQFAPRPDPAAEAASAAALLRLTQAMAAFDPAPAGVSDLRRAGLIDERVHLAPSLMAGRDYMERHVA